jgi:hypothetical protein
MVSLKIKNIFIQRIMTNAKEKTVMTIQILLNNDFKIKNANLKLIFQKLCFMDESINLLFKEHLLKSLEQYLSMVAQKQRFQYFPRLDLLI